MKELMKVRKTIKAKKPKFVRQEGYKRKRLSRSGWRAPKGMHSKMRKKMGGKRKQPSVGYSSPRAIKGFTKDGLKPVLVRTISDLKNVKDEAIIVAKKLGLRKKVQLLEKIKELKLKVINIKNVEQFIKKTKEKVELRKKERKEAIKSKEEKEKKTKEKPKKEEKKETEEEKEKREKEEKRKILEQK